MRCALFSSSPDEERRAQLLINVRNEAARKDGLDGGFFFLRQLSFGFNLLPKLKANLSFQLPTSTTLLNWAISQVLVPLHVPGTCLWDHENFLITTENFLF